MDSNRPVHLACPHLTTVWIIFIEREQNIFPWLRLIRCFSLKGHLRLLQLVAINYIWNKYNSILFRELGSSLLAMCLWEPAYRLMNVFEPVRPTALKSKRCLLNQLHAEKDLQPLSIQQSAVCHADGRKDDEKWEHGKGEPYNFFWNPSSHSVRSLFWVLSRHFCSCTGHCPSTCSPLCMCPR